MMHWWWVLIHSSQLKSQNQWEKQPNCWAKPIVGSRNRNKKKKKKVSLASTTSFVCSTEKADTKSVPMQTSWPVGSGPAQPSWAAKALPAHTSSHWCGVRAPLWLPLLFLEPQLSSFTAQPAIFPVLQNSLFIVPSVPPICFCCSWRSRAEQNRTEQNRLWQAMRMDMQAHLHFRLRAEWSGPPSQSLPFCSAAEGMFSCACCCCWQAY